LFHSGQDFAFGSPLFHEIGHHVHRTQAPEFRDREDVADRWRDRLLIPYFRRRYWYLVPLVRPIWRVTRVVRAVWSRLVGANAASRREPASTPRLQRTARERRR